MALSGSNMRQHRRTKVKDGSKVRRKWNIMVFKEKMGRRGEMLMHVM